MISFFLSFLQNSRPTHSGSAAHSLMFWIISTRPCVFLKCWEAAGKGSPDHRGREHRGGYADPPTQQITAALMAIPYAPGLRWVLRRTFPDASFKEGLAWITGFTAEYESVFGRRKKKTASTLEWETNEACHNSLKAKRNGKTSLFQLRHRAASLPIRTDKYIKSGASRWWSLATFFCLMLSAAPLQADGPPRPPPTPPPLPHHHHRLPRFASAALIIQWFCCQRGILGERKHAPAHEPLDCDGTHCSPLNNVFTLMSVMLGRPREL